MGSLDQSLNAKGCRNVLKRRGLPKIHRATSRVVRGATKPRWAACISEFRTRQEFAVDLFYFGHIHPAVMFPLDDRLKSANHYV